METNSNIENQELQKRQVEYKFNLDLKRDTERRLDELRHQTARVIQARKDIEKYRKLQLEQQKQAFKEAIKQKDYKGIKEHSKNIASLENELKDAKSLSLQSAKINSLTKQNKALAGRINERMEIMHMREARARNWFTKSSAKFYNQFSGLKLDAMENKLAKQQYKLKNSIEQYNKKYQTAFTYQKEDLNKDLNIQSNVKNAKEVKNEFKSTEAFNKKEIVNKEHIKDYKIDKDKYNNNTYAKDNTKVIDDGLSLKVKGGTDKEQAKALLDVARAKGWNLEKIQASGSKEFKAEFEQQKQQLIQQQKGTDYTKVNQDLNKEIKKEQDKVPTQKSEQIKDNGSADANSRMYKEIQKLKEQNAKLEREVKQYKAKEQREQEQKKQQEHKQESKLDNAFSHLDAMKKQKVSLDDVRKHQQQEKRQEKDSISQKRY